MAWYYIVLIILFAHIFFFLVGLLCIYTFVFHSPSKAQNNFYNIPKDEQFQSQKKNMTALIDWLLAQPYESVCIPSHDGLNLKGRYYHHADNAPLVIGFHGYRGTAIRDMVGLSKICDKQKWNMLIVDQRAHGESDGATITFGIKERHDCLAWANYASQRFGKNTPIFLCGVSMGGATVLMSAALPLPKNVCGLLVDCPYAAPEEIIRKVCKDRHIWDKAAYPIIWLSAKLLGGFSLTEASAEEAVKNCHLPILMLHGKADRLIPCATSERMAANHPHVHLHTFEDAGHGLSGILHNERYCQIAVTFVDEQIEKFKNPQA